MVPDTPGKIGIFIDQALLPGPVAPARIKRRKDRMVAARPVSGKTGIHGTSEGEMEAQQRAALERIPIESPTSTFSFQPSLRGAKRRSNPPFRGRMIASLRSQ